MPSTCRKPLTSAFELCLPFWKAALAPGSSRTGYTSWKLSCSLCRQVSRKFANTFFWHLHHHAIKAPARTWAKDQCVDAHTNKHCNGESPKFIQSRKMSWADEPGSPVLSLPTVCVGQTKNWNITITLWSKKGHFGGGCTLNPEAFANCWEHQERVVGSSWWSLHHGKSGVPIPVHLLGLK